MKKNPKILIKQLTRVIIILIAIGAISGPLEAQIPPPGNGGYPHVTVLSSDESGLTLKVDFPGFQSSQVQVDGTVFDVLEVLGCGKTAEVGKSAIPTYGFMVAVPPDAMLEVFVTDEQKSTLENFLVYPAQEPAPDAAVQTWPPFPTPPFDVNDVFYATDANYPATILQFTTAGLLRNQRVLPLRVAAFQHNPVTKKLLAYSWVIVRIEFMPYGPAVAAPNPEGPSPRFQALYSGLVNYKAPAAELALIEPAEAGCDFLIITTPALVDAANTLAARRNGQGLITLVRTTTDTGSTADSIKAYIQNAYDTWTLAPSYLLLLGDAELIPTFYRTVHLSAGSFYPAGFHTGTDLYYAILNGPEAAPPYFDEYWTPDLFHGRIPVDDLTQANAVIDKIIDYEDNQWTGGEDQLSMSGYFQDDDVDGFEDRRFVLTSEEIRDFLMGEGYQVDRLYCTELAVTPTNYNNGTYDTCVALPADLLRPVFPWDADTPDITDAINDGRFTVFHRDHGGSLNRPSSSVEGWGDPEYQDTDVTALTNTDHLPVVFSINCETGWFDGETDEYAGWAYESLCEAFLRDDDAGAVGVMGATRISSSGWNDDLAKGFVDAIWPHFDPGQGPPTPQLTMGEILNYGKLYMYNLGGGWPWDREQQQYEIFHYFGDPTMEFKIPVTVVAIDIRHGSCPAPLNLKSRGVIPVSILGAADLDVTDVDIATVEIAGAKPIRSNFQDGATRRADGNDCQCVRGRPDGYTDLVLKFRTPDIVEGLLSANGNLVKNETIVLTLTGLLLDGTSIQGQDCAIIRGNVPDAIKAKKSDINRDGKVNLRDLILLKKHWQKSTRLD
jgi:hypothetical protein